MECLTDLGTGGTEWIEVRSVNDSNLFNRLYLVLDRGEAEAIALAVEIQAERLIIDEKKGRNEAIKLGIKVTGILGVLLAAKQEGSLRSIAPVLDRLRMTGFWVRDDLYREVLLLAGEI